MSDDRDVQDVFQIASIDLGRVLRPGDTFVVRYTFTYGDDGDAVIGDVSADLEERALGH